MDLAKKVHECFKVKKDKSDDNKKDVEMTDESK